MNRRGYDQCHVTGRCAAVSVGTILPTNSRLLGRLEFGILLEGLA